MKSFDQWWLDFDQTRPARHRQLAEQAFAAGVAAASEDVRRIVIEEMVRMQVVVEKGPMRIGPCCNCSDYRHGESTGGWLCPAHGKQL